MTELKLLQKKHREEAALRRENVKKRKRRTHRLIERGAILESAINEILPAESLSNAQIEQIVFQSILDRKTIDRLIQMGREIPSVFIRRAHLYTTLRGGVVSAHRRLNTKKEF